MGACTVRWLKFFLLGLLALPVQRGEAATLPSGLVRGADVVLSRTLAPRPLAVAAPDGSGLVLFAPVTAGLPCRAVDGCASGLDLAHIAPRRSLVFQPGPLTEPALAAMPAPKPPSVTRSAATAIAGDRGPVPTSRTSGALGFASAGATASGAPANGGARATASATASLIAPIDDAGPAPSFLSSDADESDLRLLDFEGFETPGRHEGPLRLGGATITRLDGPDTFFLYGSGDYGMGEQGGFCALSPGFRCMGDVSMVFDTLVSDLVFTSYYAKRGDLSEVRLWRHDDLVGTIMIPSAGRIDLGEFGLLSHLHIIDKSALSTSGMAYGNFQYSIYRQEISAVPLPASAAMLLVSAGVLAAVGGVFRRGSR